MLWIFPENRIEELLIGEEVENVRDSTERLVRHVTLDKKLQWRVALTQNLNQVQPVVAEINLQNIISISDAVALVVVFKENGLPRKNSWQPLLRSETLSWTFQRV